MACDKCLRWWITVAAIAHVMIAINYWRSR